MLFRSPIALGILAASGQLDLAALQGYRWAGELSLSGDVRPVKGALAMALALQQSGQPGRLVLPPGSAEEAARVADLAVYRVSTLMSVAEHWALQRSAADPSRSHDGWHRLTAPAHPPQPAQVADLADVRGQPGARRALEIAAAGGHSLLLIGPPGTGK